MNCKFHSSCGTTVNIYKYNMAIQSKVVIIVLNKNGAWITHAIRRAS